MNYSIKYVANVTGLSEHRIRAWEKRYQLLKPERSQKGRRLYQDTDIEKLKTVGQLVESGDKIGNLANLSDQKLKARAEKLPLSIERTQLNGRKLTNDEKELKLFILENSLMGHRIDVLAHELKRSENIALAPYLDGVLIPFFKRVQDLDQKGRLVSGREDLIKRLIAQELKSEFFALQEKLHFEKESQFDALVGTTDRKFGEVDSWLCALRILMAGSSVFHLGALGNAETMRDLIKTLKPKKIVLTDRVDGPTTSLSSSKILGEVFPNRGSLPYCPLPKEDFLWEQDDTEILLLLQGPKAKRTGALESFQGLRLFESLDGLQGHLGKSVRKKKSSDGDAFYSEEVSA